VVYCPFSLPLPFVAFPSRYRHYSLIVWSINFNNFHMLTQQFQQIISTPEMENPYSD